MTKIKIFYLTICAFGFGLATNMQVAYLTTLLQFSGVKTSIVTYLWLIAPLTGMILQPLLGLVSDNLNTRFGQRKPLFFISTLLGVFSLCVFPFIKNLILIVIVIILLDVGVNGNAQLSRTLILDNTKDQDRAKAFSYSCALSGAGAMFAGILPWILVHLLNFSPHPEITATLPNYIYYTFLIGAFFYLLSSLITLIMFQEKKAHVKLNAHKIIKFATIKSSLADSIKNLPQHFWKLTSILFFAWIAVFSVWTYLNINLAQTSFKMPIAITDNLELAANYLTQANLWTASYFGLLQISSTIFALLIPVFLRYISIYYLFAIGLGVGSLSLLFITLSTNTTIIGIYMLFYGVSWACIATCPYIIFAKIIPKKNNGFFMGILNLVIVIPQIVTGMTLGFIYKYVFFKNANYVILTASICLLISTCFSLSSYFQRKKLKYKKNNLLKTNLV